MQKNIVQNSCTLGVPKPFFASFQCNLDICGLAFVKARYIYSEEATVVVRTSETSANKKFKL